MEWFVTYQDFNSQKFKRVNILKYYEDFIKRLESEYNYLDSIGVFYYDVRDFDRHPEPRR